MHIRRWTQVDPIRRQSSHPWAFGLTSRTVSMCSQGLSAIVLLLERVIAMLGVRGTGRQGRARQSDPPKGENHELGTQYGRQQGTRGTHPGRRRSEPTYLLSARREPERRG